MRAVGVCLVLAMAALQSMSSARVIVGVGGSAGEYDLDGDGRPDILASSAVIPGNYIHREEASLSAYPGSNVVFTATTLPLGSTVGPSTSFGLTEIDESASETLDLNTGVWHVDNAGGVADGEYGLRLTSQDGAHYGWAEVHVQATVPNFASAFVINWGYESDPNTAVTVSLVPEPASAAMLLVGAPVLVWRRRSK